MEPMYYIGLDVHKRKISYCMKDSSGRVITKGIQVDVGSGETRSFCCNSHYLEWWKVNHST